MHALPIPDWLSAETPDTGAGIALALTAIVLCLMGGAMFTYQRRRYDFAFWWSLFMIADGLVYAALAYEILSSPKGAKLWGVVLVIATGVLAMLAFRAWARERRW
jgi:hypothetical protein